MQEQRQNKRFPVKGVARYSIKSSNLMQSLSITNFSCKGIGIGIPDHTNIHTSDDIKLEAILQPLTSTITINGTILWTKPLQGSNDFVIVGGIEFKEITPMQNWRLLNYAYNHSYEHLNERSNPVQFTNNVPLMMTKELTENDVVLNTLAKKNSIVECISKIGDQIVITVNDSQWLELSKPQKYVLAGILNNIANAGDNAKQVIVRSNNGNIVARLPKGQKKNKPMVIIE